jgi:hypothetical protein
MRASSAFSRAVSCSSEICMFVISLFICATVCSYSNSRAFSRRTLDRRALRHIDAGIAKASPNTALHVTLKHSRRALTFDQEIAVDDLALPLQQTNVAFDQASIELSRLLRSSGGLGSQLYAGRDPPAVSRLN